MDDLALWNFALSGYRREGVAPACLDLQEKYGADINLVFLALWCGSLGIELDEAQMAALDRSVQAWHEGVVKPLRQARRAMKVPPEALADLPVEDLRKKVQAVELETERLEEILLVRQIRMLVGEPGNPAPADGGRRCAASNLGLYLRGIGAEEGGAFQAQAEELIRLVMPDSQG